MRGDVWACASIGQRIRRAREAALDLIDKHRRVERKGGKRRITLDEDKGFDVADFVEALRNRKVTPHMAVHDHLAKTGTGPTPMMRSAMPAEAMPTMRARGSSPAWT